MQIARDVVIDGPGGDLTLRVYAPPHGPAASLRPVIVFAHGGGFVFCDLDSHDEFCRSMAQAVDAVVVAVDYRLRRSIRPPRLPWRTCTRRCAGPWRTSRPTGATRPGCSRGRQCGRKSLGGGRSGRTRTRGTVHRGPDPAVPGDR